MPLFRAKNNQTEPVQQDSESLTSINEMLYKRSAELAIKNKALSLLGHLYETSIQTLSATDLARLITEAVRQALNYDLVTVFHYEKDNDRFVELGASLSERLVDEVRLSGYSLQGVVIEHVSATNFYEPIIIGRLPIMGEKFGYLLKNAIPEEEVERIAEQTHLLASVIYPLVLGDRVLGALTISLNREYATLPEYEKEIISSIVNVISLALDKTFVYDELKIANEKLQSLDKLKTEFLSLASHQLRSPLTAIKGYTSMLLEGSFGQITPEQKEAIDRVFQSSTHLAKVVEDLLNVSKIEQGGMKYEMSQFDFEKSVHDLATDLSITAEKKGLTLTFETDNKPPYLVYGDMEKLRQVVLNIIDNAIKYTQSGSIKVRLTQNFRTSSVRLDITDTGMGIAHEEKEKLFQKFSRGEGGKMNTSGSGLGLYLARQIIGAHKGSIAIDSPGIGKGSTFTLELPVQEKK